LKPKSTTNSTMNIEEFINQYKTEDYKFWKYRDINGKSINMHFFFETHFDYLDKYLSFYKQLPNLTEVLVCASDGIFKLTNNGIEYFIRHNHQEVFLDSTGNKRGVSDEISKQVRDNLIKRINDILKSINFDEIYQIVTECKVSGFGELSIYDTALRISSYLDIEPDKIYLHAGARQGMAILESKGYVKNGCSKKKCVEMEEMPESIQTLKAKEAEHMLCSMKDTMIKLEALKNE